MYRCLLRGSAGRCSVLRSHLHQLESPIKTLGDHSRTSFLLLSRASSLTTHSIFHTARYLSLTPCSTFLTPCSKSLTPHYKSLTTHSFSLTARESVLLQSRSFSLTSDRQCQPDKPEQKVGLAAKFKQMAKDYWYVLIPVHLATSVVWFGGFYMLAKSGVDLIAVLQALSVPPSVTEKLSGSEAGYYALAYACYKVATPIRYTVTIGGTTYTVKTLTQMGYLKTSKEMAGRMKDKKDDMMEKMDDMKEKMKDKKEDMLEKYQTKKVELKEEWENSWEKFAKRKGK